MKKIFGIYYFFVSSCQQLIDINTFFEKDAPLGD